jgi:multidrug resistance protein MdtO
VIAVGVPIWERHVSAETNVEDTLWLTLAVSVGVVVTAVIELAFARVKPGDEILLPVVERLSAVESLLDCYAEGNPTDASKKKVIRFGMLGTSSLRRLLRRANYSTQYRAEMSGVVALVGRLVDITATLTGLSFKPTDTDAEQLRTLGMAVAVIRTDLMNRRISSTIHFDPDHAPSHIPLLNEMQHIVSLIPQAFTYSESRKCTCQLRPTRCNRRSWHRMHSSTLSILSSHCEGAWRLVAVTSSITPSHGRVSAHPR